ncbi:dynein axonemal intermediate chain 4-like [Penaeus japonicus]|uniref:dynein axonemal intermediate chain 4-like n=1 Tax=Penaeus japonicus TaxID=27405 RepID=UPI001C70FF61|nr:dynein axonemal intermediate chain 4-like [Penaeus japonicus]
MLNRQASSKALFTHALTRARLVPPQWLVLGTYGALGFTGRLEGILCGWNVKRIGQPELWLPLPGPPTVVSSCPGAPQLCCVALLDGTLLVYQLDTPTPQLVMDTSVSVDKHSSPVWWVEWRDSQMVSTGSTKKSHESAAGRVSFKKLVSNLKPTSSQSGAEVAYVLVSCSEDGTVKEWTFIKNTILCCTFTAASSPDLIAVVIPTWEEGAGFGRRGAGEVGPARGDTHEAGSGL